MNPKLKYYIIGLLVGTLIQLSTRLLGPHNEASCREIYSLCSCSCPPR